MKSLLIRSREILYRHAAALLLVVISASSPCACISTAPHRTDFQSRSFTQRSVQAHPWPEPARRHLQGAQNDSPAPYSPSISPPPPHPSPQPDPPDAPPQPPESPFIDPPYVGVGMYVLNAGMDDLYQGYVDLDFLLYTKSFGILSNGKILPRDAAMLLGGACGPETLARQTADWWFLHKQKPPSPPPRDEGPTRAFLVNSYNKPVFENCPIGAVQAAVLDPSMGVGCWRVQGKFTYSVDMVNFPFDVQSFEIMLEDESDGFGADYCMLQPISGLSSEMKSVAEKMTWGYHLQSKCYPPFVTCVNGTEEACTMLEKKGSPEEECSQWERFGVPDGATKRHQIIMTISVHYVTRKVLLRYFLVPLCSIFIMLSTYALDPLENLSSRYSVSSGLLISTILFHVNSVMKATSHTSKLSYFDMIMMLVYAINAVTVQFNVSVFLIDRRIVRIDRRRGTEVYRSEGHKLYLKAINDAVFCIVLAGTLVGLIGLFSFHTAYAGLSMIILGPPIGFYIVHILKWHTLPGNDSGFTPNSHSNVHAWGRKLRWRLRHAWRKRRGKRAEDPNDDLFTEFDPDDPSEVELNLLPRSDSEQKLNSEANLPVDVVCRRERA
eukprot:CAMPEP_0114239334 /NCGR_PEP_ID=MMETSP0058-20121206/8403_1 /TAXON_ID=36894 /ORGANISM="Pyramimonas parkeae, CCMP726" /LENGTH=607 /DNA_ID=CAMNT_0001351505 /DNA_START=377 /DNA_END=2200 /DNA_ORIENTATION=+